MARLRVRSHLGTLAVALAIPAGCGWQPDEAALTTPRPPAAAFAPIGGAMPLEEMLALLERDVREAIDLELQVPDGEEALLRAEALTDRLLEASLPFDWLVADQYSLHARLRQIQSQADRAVAALISGLPREDVLGETRELHRQVTTLRHAVAAGGGPRRMPVDRLIEALDTLRTPPAPVPDPVQPAPGDGAPPAAAPPDTVG